MLCCQLPSVRQLLLLLGGCSQPAAAAASQLLPASCCQPATPGMLVPLLTCQHPHAIQIHSYSSRTHHFLHDPTQPASQPILTVNFGCRGVCCQYGAQEFAWQGASGFHGHNSLLAAHCGAVDCRGMQGDCTVQVPAARCRAFCL
jgi:hypothetical protein